MIKSFAQRHWLAGVLFLLCVGIMVLPRHNAYNETAAVLSVEQTKPPVDASTEHSATSIDPALANDEKAAISQNLLRQSIAQLDKDLAAHSSIGIEKQLDNIQSYQRLILSALPHLSPSQKMSLTQMCDEQMNILRPNLYIMPESDQFDSQLILANCSVIQKAVSE